MTSMAMYLQGPKIIMISIRFLGSPALCTEGSGCGGVTRIPEFSQQNGGSYGKQFDIIWVGSQIPGGVNYKGYVKVGNNTYLIANLNNPRIGGYPGGEHQDKSGPGSVINYATQHNYFARGRTNNSGRRPNSWNTLRRW